MITPPECSQEIKHKTLSAYYHRVCTLPSWFGVPLVVADDPASYVDFLSGTLCATRDKSCPAIPPLTNGSTDDGRMRSQQECVDWIMHDLAGRGKNVLVKNERYGRFKEEEVLPGRTSPATVLLGQNWRILRSRIGDPALRHLVLHTSLYKLVGNNSYLQITGQPACDLYAGTQKRKNAPKRKRTRQEVPGRKRRKVEEVDEQRPRELTNGPADRYISRQRMFYGQPAKTRKGKFVAGLHPQHLLNETFSPSDSAPDVSASERLLRVIFFSKPGAAVSGEIKNEGRRAKMLETMSEILNRHHAIDYGSLLRVCVDRSRDHTLEGLQPLSASQVCRFVTAILKLLLPITISGSEHNVQSLFRHARRFVLAKQFESINLHSLMLDLRIGDITWLHSDCVRPNPGEGAIRRRLAENFVFWLFEDYLVPLIRNTFYVTETGLTRYETVYYPHEAWHKASKPHFVKLQKELLEPLDSHQRAAAMQGALGVSAVRLIPKANGFRPIVNLGRLSSRKKGVVKAVQKGNTANSLLRGVHQVLTFEKERKRAILGSSLFGTNEIFAPIQSLKEELSKQDERLPRLYFVKMDIRAAFDTIKQDKVLSVISSLLDDNYDYLLMLYSLLLPPASKASQGSARRLFKTRAVLDNGHGNFDSVAHGIAKPLRNAVIADLQRPKRITKEECMRLLRQHIKHNTWRVDTQLFRQREGIPQGSMISSMLCSLFYASLEREYLSLLSKPGSRLLRYIDDFLYITDDLSAARRFISIMSRGFPEYGAFISPNKTLRSFEYAKGDSVGAVCALEPDGSTHFPFCGFWIDTATLEMGMDTPRIIAGDMEQSFALRFARRRGQAFVGWLSRQLENRNHTAYLNTDHNALKVVHANIFLNFATTAMKVPHYFGKTDDITPQFAQMIYASICLSIEYTFVAGRARVRHAASDAKDPARHHRVRKADFEFLAKSAILLVLTRKAGRFKAIVQLLKLDLDRQAYRSMRGKHEATVSAGWIEVRHATY